MSQPRPHVVTRALLDWYDSHRRRLPWRAAAGARPDPYHVWLSEVMLQQTTVAAVQPYYARFLALWPTVEQLAAAPREHLLREWAGLGYYARARNLHACAQAVVERHGGTFPSSEAALRRLPGIGDYTAAAVAAIAFGLPATVVDGNVERVVARLFAVEEPLPAARPLIRRLAADLAPRDRPGDFAQATMDFGATLCTPRSPACAICPVRPHCKALSSGAPAGYPRRAPKRRRPQKFGASALIRRGDGAVLVRTRPVPGLLGGMTEFFGTAWTESKAETATLLAIADRELRACGEVDHGFTHFDLRLEVFRGRTSASEAPEGYRWSSADALDLEPMPTLMRKVLRVAEADASALVSLGQDGLGLVGVEGADQQGGRKRENRQAQAAQGARKGHEMSEADGGRTST